MMRAPVGARLGAAAFVVAAGLMLTACVGEDAEQPDLSASAETERPAAATPEPLIPDDVLAELDAAVAAESTPISSTDAQTEGLPGGARLDVLALRRTESGGYSLRVRLSFAQETQLSPDEHRSLSQDGKQTFVDGIRLVDQDVGRYTLPVVYAPKDEEQIDDTERFRCLCSDLVSRIPTSGQILAALYGPLGDGAAPAALTVEVPGFEPLEDVPVSTSAD